MYGCVCMCVCICGMRNEEYHGSDETTTDDLGGTRDKHSMKQRGRRECKRVSRQPPPIEKKRVKRWRRPDTHETRNDRRWHERQRRDGGNDT